MLNGKEVNVESKEEIKSFRKISEAPPRYMQAFDAENWGTIRVTVARWKDYVLDCAGLTDKERQIAELILEGHDTKEIAKRANNTDKTVKHHISKIFIKFDVTSRAELFAEIFGLGERFNGGIRD